MYIFNGKKLTEEQAKKFAEETGRDLQTFLEANPDIQEDPDFGPQDKLGKPEVAVEEVVPAVTEDTALQSEDGSLELPKNKYKTPLTRDEKISLQNNKFAKQMSKEDNFTKERLEELTREQSKGIKLDELEESIETFENNLIDLNPSNLSQEDLMLVQNTAIDYLVSTSEDPDNYNYTEEEVNDVTKNILSQASDIRNRKKQLKDQVTGTTATESLRSGWENLKSDINIFSGSSKSNEFWNGDSEALDIASAAIYNGIFGKENIDAYLAKLEGLPDGLVKEFLTTGLGTEELLESIPKFEEQQQRKLQTLPIIESFKQGEIIKGGAAVLSGIISGIGSIGYGIATAGAGFSIDYVAENYIEFNEGLATRKNKSIEQLILDGEDNIRVPVGIAAIQSLAENIGIGRIIKPGKITPKTNSISKEFFKSPYGIRTADMLGAGTTEFTTEIVQGGLGVYNEILGKTGDTTDAFEGFVSHIASQQGLEEGIQGFVTGAGIKGSSYVLKSVNNFRSPDESEAIQADIVELGDLAKQAQQTTSKVVKEGVEAKIKEVRSRLDSRIIKGNALFSKLTPTEIDEVNSMSDLGDLQVKRVKELNIELDKGEISKQEYLVALEGFKSTFINAKNRIKGISVSVKERNDTESEAIVAEDVDTEVSADNLLKSSINEENTAIVLNPESTPAQVDKAKTALVENNEGIINNVINKSFNTNLDTNLTREEFAADIGLEVQKLINTYGKNKKTGKKAPFGAYLAENLPKRVPAIFDKQIETVDGDIIGKVDVSKAEQEINEDNDIDLGETKQEKERVLLNEEIVLPDDINNKIKEVVTRLFSKSKIPKIGTKEFIKSVEGTYKNELKPIMAEFLGKNTDGSLEIFLRNNFKEIYAGIPQTIINKRFPAFKEAVLDKEGKQVREKTPQGNPVFKKKDITPAEFIKNFLGTNVKPSTRGTRKDALAETLAIIYANEASLDILKNAEVQKDLKAIESLKPEDQIQSVDKIINYLEKNWGTRSGKLFTGLSFIPDAIIGGLKVYKEAIKQGKSAAQATARFVKHVVSKFSDKKEAAVAKKIITTEQKNAGGLLNVDINGLIDEIARLTGKNRGIAYERVIYDGAKGVKNPIFKIKGVQTEKGAAPDIQFEIAGITFNIEAKLGEAQYGSINGKYDFKAQDFTFAKKTKISSKLQNILDKVLEKAKPKLDKYYKKAKELGVDLEDSGILIPLEVFNELQAEGLQKEITTKQTVDQSIIEELYGAKGVYYMQIEGKGLYYIGENPLGLPIPKLEGDVQLTFRIARSETNKNGEVRPTLRFLPDKIDLKTGKSNHRIDTAEGINNLLATKEVQDLVKLQASKQKAAKNNNETLPTDDKLKDNPTNTEVLNKMTEIDDKSTTEELKSNESLDLNKDFNDIIENKTGIASDKTYARVKAEVVGANKGRFNFFIPPSAEDFVGLLYSTLGKGSIGDAQMAWYKAHLLNPFAKAMENLANSRQALMQDFKALKKDLNIVPKNLRKKIDGEPFTREQALRVYIWDKQGMEVPGLSKKDQKDLVDYVNNNSDLAVFGDQLIEINKGVEYAAPGEGWVAGTIDTDLIKGLDTTIRSKYLEVWQNNSDTIFDEENLNKLEAAYGKPYRVALENMLYRMKTGRNRNFGNDDITGRFTDWLTNSVGAIMFFNTRSAVLQTISAINFINFSDNNVLKAGQAFANQPQYWKDFKKLFNSPFLLDRRSGLKLNVNETDIADMAKGPGNSARNVIAGILKAGFLPTQIADSFAIASGGASFYRNRIKALQKEGLTEVEAEEIAFRDFREIAEESQQSSRPDKISQQQAGPLGRIVLAFANTPAQYARLIKKAASDLKNRRGDDKTNISKIIYYGVAQNLLFSALQQALFAVGFGDDEDEDENTKTAKKREEKYFNIANGMADSVLRGIGVQGAIISVIKNTAIRLAKEADKKSSKYQDAVVKGVLQISPPVSSKIGKLQSAGRSFSWNQEEMRTKGWSIDNPAYLASANVISAMTNLPLDRAVKKITNVVDAGNQETEYYKRIALALGWSAWELDIDKKGKKQAKTIEQKLFDLSKKQQIDSLKSLGLSKNKIKELKYEKDRVEAIINKQKQEN